MRAPADSGERVSGNRHLDEQHSTHGYGRAADGRPVTTIQIDGVPTVVTYKHLIPEEGRSKNILPPRQWARRPMRPKLDRYISPVVWVRTVGSIIDHELECPVTEGLALEV
jgi:hypothetical protein